MVTSSAAGKTILLGEHAVVYGRPAIAVPVSDLRATVQITPISPGEGVQIDAADLGHVYRLDESYDDDDALPLQTTVRNALYAVGADPDKQALRITIRSRIPIASGMGSGTAVATALVRGISRHYRQPMAPDVVSELVYRTEILLHGTPSGIDNTVVAFEEPVYFVRGSGVETFPVGRPFTLIIGDSGVPARTRYAVDGVRRRRESDPARYDKLFDEIGAIVERGREAIIQGELADLGQTMTENHALLRAIQVSGEMLERLVCAALEAGAPGAKLSGGGIGGCMIALTDEAGAKDVTEALYRVGARRVMVTVVR
ncbi:MAG TPA: mevalonate kinase [Chloroflexi bacterium]|nr:mevalonate kinase [Chloroflexota bacterium]